MPFDPFVLAIRAVQEADGLTLGELLADIPHDGASLFIYALLALSMFVVWRANRRKGGGDPE